VFGGSGALPSTSTALTVRSVTVGTCDVPLVGVSAVVDFSVTINGAPLASATPQ
jgi:hypothetical protein